MDRAMQIVSEPKQENEMKNIDMKVDGEILTIKVDLSKNFGPSRTGKTVIVASTEGNIRVEGRDEQVGLNVYRRR